MKSQRLLVQDSLAIALVVLLSAALYVPFLGFYSDDWTFLWYVLGDPRRQSLGEMLWRTFSLTDSIMTRPVHALYAGILLAVFGAQPLGHHVVNSSVIAASAVLFYLVLREIGQDRLTALAAALLFGLLPHYATDRFWFVTIQVALSAAAYFISLLADLKATGRPAGRRWPLRMVSVVALLTSVMSYEIFMPLIVLNPVVVWFCHRRHGTAEWRSILPFAVVQLAIVIACGVFKAIYTARMVEATAIDHVVWFGKLLAIAFYTLVFGDFGLRLPLVLWDIVARQDVAPVVGAGLLAGMVVLVYLRRAARETGAMLADRVAHARRIAAGALLVIAGYSIFFVTFTAGISTTGINNRTSMAAVIGIALGIVGVLGWAVTWFPPTWRVSIFTAAVATLCASGFIIVNTLGLYWGAAAARQRVVLAAVKRDVPTLPSGSTLLLDGLCPYVGPAPVFDSWWDISAALRLVYRDDSLAGDIVKPSLEITEEGIYTHIWDKRIGPYRYQTLLVYNLQRSHVQRLPGPLAAREYFAAFDPDRDSSCRPSREGDGERLFVPGARRIGFPPLSASE